MFSSIRSSTNFTTRKNSFYRRGSTVTGGVNLNNGGSIDTNGVNVVCNDAESQDSVSSLTPQHQRNSGGYLQHRYAHPSAEQQAERREKVTINVSGERYQTYVETLNAFPETLLGNTLKRERFYDDVEDEYFFDRDRNAFSAILYYYQSQGQLYCPLTVPITILVTEAKFFDLGNEALKQVLDLHSKDKKRLMPKNKWQRKFWCLFEHPETSRAAHLITLFSVLMIIFSVIILCIETLPFAKEHKPPKLINYFLNITYHNKSITKIDGNEILNAYIPNYKIPLECTCKTPVLKIQELHTKSNISQPLFSELNEINWHEVFDKCEAVFVAWFTFEFIVRFLSSPNKFEFLKGFLNIIDIVSILPFYITSALNHNESFGFENFRVIRLVRVFRIFKLSRHSKGLQILGKTLKASMRELGLMIFFIAIGVILFSSAVYYLEIDNFTSIPDAFWWAIITMCTVGYGDVVPKTFWGKVVGSACAICGVLSIALPVPVIVSNFDYFYNRERTKKMHEAFIDEENNDNELTDIKIQKDSVTENKDSDPITESGSPLLNNNHKPMVRNGSARSATRSPIEARSEEIHRQQTLKGLERRSRKLSQRISESSLFMPPSRRGVGNNIAGKLSETAA